MADRRLHLGRRGDRDLGLSGDTGLIIVSKTEPRAQAIGANDRTAYASALLERIALFASNRVSIPGRHHSPPKKLTGLSALSFPEGVLLPVRLGSPVSERGEAVAQ